MLASGPAHGQTSSTDASTGAESPQGKGAVQAGAGSRGDVTTGASGPEDTANPRVAPAAPGFPLVPASDPFQGPGMLEVQTPERLRCELIGDERARRRCEVNAVQPKKEGARE
jgi:hypothetical protein